jgi:hypothetical protein
MRFIYAILINFIFVGLAFAHGVADADKASLVSGGNIDYIWQGAKHMVTGYDHLLFLFGVIFFLSKFKDIVKFITAFTIGHSITLIFATFYEITANYYLIDAVIALSVCYKGFENVGGFQKYLKMKSPNLQWAVFIFGLIHGFGLSTRLQQLPLGDDGLIWKIISFNVGVEFGQIAALSIMLIFLTQWRKTESFKKFSVASNIGLILVGAALFVFQMSGYFGGKTEGEKPVQPTHKLHKHGDGPMHVDQVMQPIRTKSKMHSHDGGPMHIDPVEEPVKKEPVNIQKSGHSHGGHGHAH